MKKSALFLASLFAGAAQPLPAAEPVAHVTAKQAAALAGDKNAFILDVRRPEEYASGHIRKSVLIPVDSLEERLSEIPRDKKVLVYCRSGARSSRAARALAEKGYKSVFNLKGGILAWQGADLPVEK